MHKNVFKEMQKKPMFEIRIICCLSLSMFNAQKKEIAGKEIKEERTETSTILPPLYEAISNILLKSKCHQLKYSNSPTN